MPKRRKITDSNLQRRDDPEGRKNTEGAEKPRKAQEFLPAEIRTRLRVGQVGAYAGPNRGAGRWGSAEERKSTGKKIFFKVDSDRKKRSWLERGRGGPASSRGF